MIVTIYVDDIKMSGPDGNLHEGWELIRSKIGIGEVSPANLYMGCIHTKTTTTVEGVGEVSVMEYNMEMYLKQIVEDYEELASELTGRNVVLKDNVMTPFIEEDCSRADARAPKHKDHPYIDCPYCRHSFSPIANAKTLEDVLKFIQTAANAEHLKADGRNPSTPHGVAEKVHDDGHGEQCAVAEGAPEYRPKPKYGSSGGKPKPGSIVLPAVKKFTKGFKKIREKLQAAKAKRASGEVEDRGQLGPLATSILMRILYAAREARFDLLRAVNKMSCMVAYWNSDADRRLEKLVSYIKSTLHYRQFGWIGDDAKFLQPHAYTDADFAGCARTLRSTTGIQMQIEGPNSCFPIAASSKRQPHVSDSTPAAELSALHTLLKAVAIPFADIAEKILPEVRGVVHEDNTTAIQAIKTGKNQTMRFLPRSNGVSVQMLHENLNGKNKDVPYNVVYCDSHLMVADIHTKGFTDEKRWRHAHTMAGIMSKDELPDRIRHHKQYFGFNEKIPKEEN